MERFLFNNHYPTSMNIATISTRFYPAVGGVETNSWEISRRLAMDDNNKVIALSSEINTVDPRTYLPAHQVIENVNIFRFKNIMPHFIDKNGITGLIMPSLSLSFKKFINEYKIQIVHSHGYGFYPTYGILPFARKRNFKWVISAHTSSESKLPRFLYDKSLGNLAIKNADIIIVLSELERNFFLKLGARKEQLRLIPNGIFSEIPHLDKPDKEYDQILQEKYILFVGRLAPNKGLSILIEAFSKMKDKQLKLFIAGPDGGCLKNLEQLVREKSLSNNVLFLGYTNNNTLHWLYKNSLFFCAPSTYGEAQNISATQALSYKKPVIVSNSGGMGDFYRNVNGAFIIEPGNANKLKEAIEYVYKNLENIKISYDKNTIMTWEEVSDKVKNIYLELLEK